MFFFFFLISNNFIKKKPSILGERTQTAQKEQESMRSITFVKLNNPVTDNQSNNNR